MKGYFYNNIGLGGGGQILRGKLCKAVGKQESLAVHSAFITILLICSKLPESIKTPAVQKHAHSVIFGEPLLGNVWYYSTSVVVPS